MKTSVFLFQLNIVMANVVVRLLIQFLSLSQKATSILFCFTFTCAHHLIAYAYYMAFSL